ncbi:aspartate/glutamate racemase family protein [Paradevosia shaoguanensis]|uniref:aspartate/glutamate racemase family protein n=1 Tax=Paradevosia shaoguanensis TaxID=1335043 RepID=UPI001931326B|nr:aspartate/glutamate racemase family protein [Paradevosia shaoguanensis]
MPRLLVINPNTSQRVSHSIDALVREEAGKRAEVTTITANFGFRYISSRAAVAIAAHAVLDAAARAIADGAAPDAIILGCFGDPGLDALVEMTGIPVIGFAEAGLLAAASEHGNFIVATKGVVWCEMLTELIQKLGLSHRVAGVYSVEQAGDDADGIAEYLSARARETGASRIVLGGAGLIPTLPRVIALSPVPVLDPHRAGVRKAMTLATEGRHFPSDGSRGETTGLSAALTEAFSGPTEVPLQVGNAH